MLSAMCVECGEFMRIDQVVKCRVCPLTYHQSCADINILHRIRVRWHCPKDFDIEKYYFEFIRSRAMVPPSTESMFMGCMHRPTRKMEGAEVPFIPMDHETMSIGRMDYGQMPYGQMPYRPVAYRPVKSRLMTYKPNIVIPPMLLPMQLPAMQLPTRQVPPIHVPQNMHVQQGQIPPMRLPQMPMGMQIRPPIYANYNGGFNRYNQ